MLDKCFFLKINLMSRNMIKRIRSRLECKLGHSHNITHCTKSSKGAQKSYNDLLKQFLYGEELYQNKSKDTF